MARVRQLSLDLRPAMLDDLGLLPALLWHMPRYSQQTERGRTLQTHRHRGAPLRAGDGDRGLSHRSGGADQRGAAQRRNPGGRPRVERRRSADRAGGGRGRRLRPRSPAGPAERPAGWPECANGSSFSAASSPLSSTPGQGAHLIATLPVAEPAGKTVREALR